MIDKQKLVEQILSDMKEYKEVAKDWTEPEGVRTHDRGAMHGLHTILRMIQRGDFDIEEAEE